MSLGYESIYSCMRFIESCKAKANVLIRAQSGTQNMTQRFETSRLTTEEEKSEIMTMARSGVSVHEMCAVIGRNRDLVRRVLAMEGFDMRHLAKPFSGQVAPSIELGKKTQNILRRGGNINAAKKALGVPLRVVYESLGMAGGYKDE